MIVTELSWLSLPLAAVAAALFLVAARVQRRRITGDPEAGITASDTATVVITAFAVLLCTPAVVSVLSLRADPRFLLPVAAGATIGSLAALARRRPGLAVWRWTAVGVLIGAVLTYAAQLAFIVFSVWLYTRL